MQAIGYIRVSTGRQAEKGLSLAEQREKQGAWAEMAGLGIEFIEDHRSGRRANKRHVYEAIERACRLKVPFVACQIDRIARNVEDACKLARRLREAGADLVLLKEQVDTTTAAGRLVFHMLASVAEWFSDQLSDRMVSSIAYRKAHGLRYGRPTFGWMLAADGKRIKPEPKEQKALAFMREARAAGRSYGWIAQDLERQGVKTKTGKAKWSKRLVKSLIERGSDEKDQDLSEQATGRTA